MSDRTSPAIFASIFGLLGSDPTEQHKAWAFQLWREALIYDFCPSTMYCDDALTTLGLCRIRVNPRYPDEGEVECYGIDGEDCQ